MTLPFFTELTDETGLIYATALAELFGLTVDKRIMPQECIQEYLLSDGSIAGLWIEDGHVYGEA